mmetsp:Transcript_7013/g.15219  ORF Transcript_7013/g.15219 Transcript_7013/m.15219 type:complete len:307 (-) Transcript_7013:749-1669(-)
MQTATSPIPHLHRWSRRRRMPARLRDPPPRRSLESPCSSPPTARLLHRGAARRRRIPSSTALVTSLPPPTTLPQRGLGAHPWRACRPLRHRPAHPCRGLRQRLRRLRGSPRSSLRESPCPPGPLTLLAAVATAQVPRWQRHPGHCRATKARRSPACRGQRKPCVSSHLGSTLKRPSSFSGSCTTAMSSCGRSRPPWWATCSGITRRARSSLGSLGGAVPAGHWTAGPVRRQPCATALPRRPETVAAAQGAWALAQAWRARPRRQGATAAVARQGRVTCRPCWKPRRSPLPPRSHHILRTSMQGPMC